MSKIALGHADYHRTVAKEAHVQTLNRYFEANPVLTDDGAALIARPALRNSITIGEGPIRATYTQPGSFSDALFTVSGTSWYRVERDTVMTSSLLADGINPNTTGMISMAGTGTIGTVPEYMYLADGRNLWLYVANGYALGTISGSPVNGDVVQIGNVYYKFTNASVDAGAPAGTAANPYLVALNLVDSVSWRNLGYGVTAKGTAGTTYSTALVPNPLALTISAAASSVTVRATAVGALGNNVPTTTTGAGLHWGHATLTGGGQASVTTVQTPDDVGIISVAFCASYIICVPVQGAGINGRFFWINPGETTIDPLNFATAERAPDPVYNVVVFGDQFWLPGESTTEVWYFTGDITSPVARLKGVTFDRGTWQGTAVQVKESMIIVDADGAVFQITGGLERISNPAIEERIRAAIEYQASQGA